MYHTPNFKFGTTDNPGTGLVKRVNPETGLRAGSARQDIRGCHVKANARKVSDGGRGVWLVVSGGSKK